MDNGNRPFFWETTPMTKNVVLPAVYLLLAVVPLHAEENENTAGKAVEKLGGKVTLDNKDPAKPIVGVDLSFTDVMDKGLKDLAPLQRLQALNLGGTKITEVGLKELAPLKMLQRLHLDGTQVTDQGLKELAALKGLRWLTLGSTKVTSTGLKD